MNASALEVQPSPGLSARVARVALWGAVLLGCAIFWVAPRTSMGDLPQHAGQVTLLHDLLTGTSRWSDLVYVNWFTPYLLAFSLATALAFVVPVVVALKLVLTAGFIAFVAAAVALREEFGGDERLDWLFLPGYFGFAFQYGFYTFLVATPVGLIFLLLAKRFAAAPSGAGAVRMVFAGLALFFSHGLVFVFCVCLKRKPSTGMSPRMGTLVSPFCTASRTRPPMTTVC